MVRMISSFKTAIILTIFLFGIGLSAYAQDTKKYALIYSGINTCDGCPEAIGDVAHKANLQIKYVSNPNNIPRLLKHASIFIIGGTDDNIEQMRHRFNKNIVSAIKKYIHNGGNFLGICGGAFIASNQYLAEENHYVDGFGIIPAKAYDYSDTATAHLELINWQNHNVLLYFQGGPTFNLDKDTKNINIIANYQNGDIAAFEYIYGRGKVVVIGPHPEADESWLKADHIHAPHWKPQQNLIVNLIKEMVSPEIRKTESTGEQSSQTR